MWEAPSFQRAVQCVRTVCCRYCNRNFWKRIVGERSVSNKPTWVCSSTSMGLVSSLLISICWSNILSASGLPAWLARAPEELGQYDPHLSNRCLPLFIAHHFSCVLTVQIHRWAAIPKGSVDRSQMSITRRKYAKVESAGNLLQRRQWFEYSDTSYRGLEKCEPTSSWVGQYHQTIFDDDPKQSGRP